jgi:dUTPase
VSTPPADLSATGFGAGGERWTLTAHSAGGRLRAMVEVVEPDGRRWVAGSGGPPLPAGRRVATFAGRSGAGARVVIVRVAADVRGVVAILTDDTREDLSLHGDAAVLGARLAVLVHPADVALASMTLVGRDGSHLAETL